jgi:sec-independent protein translocase protein TatC
MSVPGDQEQSFISHLVELRSRLLRASVAVLVVFLALTPFMRKIFELLSQPLMESLPAGTKLLATGVIAPFVVPLKVTLFVAFLIALPFVLYQVWAFVAPGLYQHERRLAGPVIASSVAMFISGMAYCYFIVFNVVFHFIAQFAPSTVNVAPDIEAYVNFVLGLFLAFGLAFEVPIVVLLIVRFGFVTVARLSQIRPYVIVGATVAAAIVTPPDVLSMTLLAVPLVVLYEIGIVLARVFGKRAAEPAKAEPAA